MRKTKQVSEIKDVVEITCDVCGDDKYYKYLTCWMCRKDICDRRECRLFDPRDSGDYPHVFCLKCWNIGENYRQAIADAEVIYEEQIEKIEKEWQSACMAARKNEENVKSPERSSFR